MKNQHIVEKVRAELPEATYFTQTSRSGHFWSLVVTEGDFSIWLESLDGHFSGGIGTAEFMPGASAHFGTYEDGAVAWLVANVEKSRVTRVWTLGKVLQFMDYLHHDAEAIRRMVPGFEKWLAEDPHITPYYMQDPMPAPLKDDE